MNSTMLINDSKSLNKLINSLKDLEQENLEHCTLDASQQYFKGKLDALEEIQKYVIRTMYLVHVE